MEERFQVGIISSTHGVRGEVKVFPTTDDVKRFNRLKEVLVEMDGGEVTLAIEQVKFFKQFAILKFRGIDSLDQVLPYKGKSLQILRKDAVALKKDEYFIADLMGMTVVDEGENLIGELTEVIETGANDVYVVNRGEEKEILLPAIRECILEVDIEKRKMKVHVLDGLMD